jgi:hypothetical protein
VFGVGISAAGAPGTADAPLTNANDNPAAPNTGRALFRRFRLETCFACDMAASFHTFGDVRPIEHTAIVRLA